MSPVALLLVASLAISAAGVRGLLCLRPSKVEWSLSHVGHALIRRKMRAKSWNSLECCVEQRKVKESVTSHETMDLATPATACDILCVTRGTSAIIFQLLRYALESAFERYRASEERTSVT
jgi:hypothetical protein